MRTWQSVCTRFNCNQSHLLTNGVAPSNSDARWEITPFVWTVVSQAFVNCLSVLWQLGHSRKLCATFSILPFSFLSEHVLHFQTTSSTLPTPHSKLLTSAISKRSITAGSFFRPNAVGALWQNEAFGTPVGWGTVLRGLKRDNAQFANRNLQRALDRQALHRAPAEGCAAFAHGTLALNAEYREMVSASVHVRGSAGVVLQFRRWPAELGSTVAFLAAPAERFYMSALPAPFV
jgi:hypothetical protein